MVGFFIWVVARSIRLSIACPAVKSSRLLAGPPRGVVGVLDAGDGDKLGEYGTNVDTTWSLLAGVSLGGKPRVHVSMVVFGSSGLLSPGEEKRLLEGQTV